jgi:hypothetical protein
MSLEDFARKAEGSVDKYGDKANEKVRPFMHKNLKWVLIGIVAFGALLFLIGAGQ